MKHSNKPKTISAKDLKEIFPLYPTVKKEDETTFSTLVRKKYDSVYYLIPMVHKGETEAKAIHGLHSEVHKYLMLGKKVMADMVDDDQTNESIRLFNLK